jgi:aconitate decarboxylase
LKATDVKEIIIRVTEDAVSHSGWSPYIPAGLTAAQMHMGFCVAMKLIEGEVFVDQMIEDNIARPDLVDLANRVKVVRNQEREQKGRMYARGTDVEVILKDGKTLKKTVDFYLGSHSRPLTADQMASKFRRLASKTLSPDNVKRIEEIVCGLERSSNVINLVKILQGTRDRAPVFV